MKRNLSCRRTDRRNPLFIIRFSGLFAYLFNTGDDHGEILALMTPFDAPRSFVLSFSFCTLLTSDPGVFMFYYCCIVLYWET